ncbi:MAG: hypothetical protein ACR2FS_15245 [Phormidesmis sp.]
MTAAEDKAELKTEICDYFTAFGANRQVLVKICASIKYDAEQDWETTLDRVGDRHHATVLGFIQRLQKINEEIADQQMRSDDAKRAAKFDAVQARFEGELEAYS